MLIASWNVNSIRTRISQVTDWITFARPDVLCIQETKVTDEDFPLQSFLDLGYQVQVYGQKSYNGVAIISKFEIENLRKGFQGEINLNDEVQALDSQKRIISGFINGIRIINLYVPNGSSLNSDKYEYKLKWLDQLGKYIDAQRDRAELTCILGDFNIALNNNDIHDPNRYEGNIMASKEERKALKKILSNSFVDSFRVFEQGSGHWSWWDYRNKAYELNKGWRIDHIYISTGLLPSLKSSVIVSSLRGNEHPSDHAPVMVELSLNDYNEAFENDDDDDLFNL